MGAHLPRADVSTEPICGLGTFGRVLIPASGGCFNVAVAAHELGHSFGLVHDRRRDARRTPSTYHADLMVTTFCAAEWLDVHPYFNVDEPISNQNTQIRTLETQNTAPAKSIRFRFQITDAGIAPSTGSAGSKDSVARPFSRMPAIKRPQRYV